MLAMIPPVVRGLTPGDIEKICEIVRKTFPAVEQRTTAEVAAWINDPSQQVLLIDVRSPAEFAVSHLAGAVNLQSARDILNAIRNQPSARPVLYCSVGYRSSRLAGALVREGVPRACNLEGSIFRWANEGRPLCRGSQETFEVHPFGRRWAGLLKEGLAVRL